MAASTEPVVLWAAAVATAVVLTVDELAVAAGLTQVCESEHDKSMGELSGSAVDDDDDRLLLLDFS